jgi:hypothetical protein
MDHSKPEPPAHDFEHDVEISSATLIDLSKYQTGISPENVVEMFKAAKALFRALMGRHGFTEQEISALITKFTDAGPRSPPWKAASSRVPGRPQDGKDGNRIQRWKLPEDHKFYATQVDGTLVAIKYIFQTLSMLDAPRTPTGVSDAFHWLVGHEIAPGEFLDPLQRVPVSLSQFVVDRRLVTSGHMHPLDRGGRHVPENTSLLLESSNNLQGNNTMEELLDLMDSILRRHRGK